LLYLPEVFVVPGTIPNTDHGVKLFFLIGKNQARSIKETALGYCIFILWGGLVAASVGHVFGKLAVGSCSHCPGNGCPALLFGIRSGQEREVEV
jgi:hypothetical protein